MKFLKKIGVCFMACLMALSVVACGSPDGGNGEFGKGERSGTTKLYVRNFNGGMGDDWLTERLTKFEELYDDKVILPGTKGVDIVVDNVNASGTSQLTEIPIKRNEMYFFEGINLADFIADDLLLDLSDYVDDPLTEFGDSESIWDKLSEDQKGYYSMGGGVYAVPHYQGYLGINYDLDLFNERGYFRKANGSFGANETFSGLSAGPDGVSKTYDDGLPATYQEFFELCEYIEKDPMGATPVTWTGAYPTYLTNLVNALACDFDGYAESKLKATYSGQAKKVVESVSDSGVITYKPEFTMDDTNGYLAYHTAGRYHGITFAEKIIKNGYYDSLSYETLYDHKMAQREFLLSNARNMPVQNRDPIAMIFEGTWWFEEAAPEFEKINDVSPNNGENDRNFKFMPYPKVSTKEVGSENVLYDINQSMAFICKKIDPNKVDLAVDFLKFCCTDEALQKFTTIVNSPKAFEYDLTPEQINELNVYGKSVWTVKQKSKIVYPNSSNQIFIKNQSGLWMQDQYEYNEYTIADAFKTYTSLTSKQLFDKTLEKWTQSSWNTLVNG